MQPIGIMQGRLSPPVGGRIQSFPVATWREEFTRAREAGLACIEWIYEVETEAANPMATEAGITEIRRLAGETGVGVWSVCADYYMAERLIAPGGALREGAVAHLRWLIRQAGSLGVRYMVLPFVDSSTLQSDAEADSLVGLLRSLVPLAEETRVELHLESDLSPRALAEILAALRHPLVRANYDIGNRASLGYAPAEELPLLGNALGSVHVKDRLLGGGTVPLGAGAADLSTCFRLFGSMGFAGPYILQVARESGLSEIALAIRNRESVERWMTAAKSPR